MEVWKKIQNHEEHYLISNTGKVFSVSVNREIKTFDCYGYRRIKLRNPFEKSYRVHRLVALHFIDNPENKPCVNHKDLDRANNNLENLEWCTHKENTHHAIKNGSYNGVDNIWPKRKGENHPRAKLSQLDVDNIRDMASRGIKNKVISQKYKISSQHVNNIKKFRIWK